MALQRKWKCRLPGVGLGFANEFRYKPYFSIRVLLAEKKGPDSEVIFPVLEEEAWHQSLLHLSKRLKNSLFSESEARGNRDRLHARTFLNWKLKSLTSLFYIEGK